MPTAGQPIAAVTPERFAQGMTFAQYLDYIATPENLAREGSERAQRSDQSGPMRDWHESLALSEAQAASIRWLAGQPGAAARLLVISEEWSSDCRRDVPVFARIAEAGGLELRIFTRDGARYSGAPEPEDSPNADLMREFVNRKPGGPYQSIPIAAFFDREWRYLYHFTEYPALYRKDAIQAALRAPRGDETPEAAAQRYARDWLALRESAFFRVWASATVDEIVTKLHERTIGLRD